MLSILYRIPDNTAGNVSESVSEKVNATKGAR